MRTDWTIERLERMRGKDVFSSDSEKIGTVEEIYYDDQTGMPEWIGLDTGFLGMKRRVVPVEAIRPQGEGLCVPYSKEKVTKEPEFDFSEGLSYDAECALCEYFDLGTHSAHTGNMVGRGERHGSGRFQGGMS